MDEEKSFLLERARYGVAITWDRARKDIDLDLQAVVVDSTGTVIDAIYHNNLSAMNGALVHTGDVIAQSDATAQELVWVDTTKLPMRVKLLIFVVAARSGGHLVDVRRGAITVLDRRKPRQPMSKYHMEKSYGDVDAVVMMKRSGFGQWCVGPIDEMAEVGESFLDIMDVISKLIRLEIPEAPKEQNVQFVMDKQEKGACLKSQVSAAMRKRNRRSVKLPLSKYSAMLSWSSEVANAHIDLCAILVDPTGTVIQMVNQSNAFALGGAVVVPFDEEVEDFNDLLDRDVHIDLEGLDSAVQLVVLAVVVVNARGLEAIPGLSMVLLDQQTEKSKARVHIQTEGVSGHCKVVMLLNRSSPGEWEMLQSESGATECSHPFDGRAHFRKIIQEFVAAAPVEAELFKLDVTKGFGLTLPASAQQSRLSCVVGWRLAEEVEHVPGLSISAVLFDKEKRPMGATTVCQNAMRMKQQAACTYMTSTAEGDGKVADEPFGQTLEVNLGGLAASVAHVVLLLNAVGSHCLQELCAASLRVSTEAGQELVRFSVPGLPTLDSGILLARLVKLDRKGWVVQAVGEPCSGHYWSDELSMMAAQELVDVPCAMLQLPTPLAEVYDDLELGNHAKSSVASIVPEYLLPPEQFEALVPESSRPDLLLGTLAAALGTHNSFQLAARRRQISGQRPARKKPSAFTSGGLRSKGSAYWASGTFEWERALSGEEMASQARPSRRVYVSEPAGADIAAGTK